MHLNHAKRTNPPPLWTESELTPHSFQPELDLLQLLRRGFPLLKQAQQLAHLATKFLLDELLLEQSAHGPGEEIGVLIRRCRRSRVVLDAELEHVFLCARQLLANDGDVDALETGAAGGTLLGRHREGGCFERVVHGEVVDARVLVDARVALAAVEAASERGGEFADQAVVGESEVAQLEREADKVREEVWGVDAAVDEDGAVYVWMGEGGEGGGLVVVVSGNSSSGEGDIPRARRAGRRCCRRRGFSRRSEEPRQVRLDTSD